jgi:hypothetical protein
MAGTKADVYPPLYVAYCVYMNGTAFPFAFAHCSSSNLAAFRCALRVSISALLQNTAPGSYCALTLSMFHKSDAAM